MKLILIAVHKEYNYDEKIVAFRIFDKDAIKYMDVKVNALFYSRLKENNDLISGLGLKDNEIIGTNGVLDRYTTLINMQIFGKSPIVILKEYPNKIFDVTNYMGKVVKMKMEDIIKYAEVEGIANGKIVTGDSGKYISAISGEYEKDSLFNDMAYGAKSKVKLNMIGNSSYKLDNNCLAYCCAKDDFDIGDITFCTGCLGIKEFGFKGSTIEKAFMNNTMTTLGAGSFAECSKLVQVNIPEGVQVIPEDCFRNCTSLKEISLPNSVTEIEKGAFRGCKKLKVIWTGPIKPVINDFGLNLLPRKK